MNKKEQPIDKKVIKHLLARNNLSATSSINKFQSGQTNRVYDLGGEYIVKIESNRPQDKDCLKGQKEISDELINTGAKIPKILEEDVYSGQRYLLMEKLKGENLAHVWWDKTDKEKENIIAQLTNELKIFHALKFKDYSLRAYRGKSFPTMKQAIIEATDFSIINISKLETEHKKMVAYLEEFFADNINVLDSKAGSVFVHNDIHFENIFVQGDNLVGIIDFDRWSKATPDYELHKIIEFFHSPDKFVKKELESKYKGLMAEEIKLIKKYYPALFTDDFLTRFRLCYVQTIIWLVSQCQAGRWSKEVMGYALEMVENFYTGDWLKRVLV